MVTTSSSLLKKVYPKREKDVHKGQFGKLLVVAGSDLYTGSPCFISAAAYRAGCDLVYLAAPRRAAVIAAHFSPMIMTHALESSSLGINHVPSILNLAKKVRATALLIGPGLGREKKTKKAILSLIKRAKLPMVIDADAIRALAKNHDVLKGKAAVLTPHANEFLELTGKKLPLGLPERARVVKFAARTLQTTLLVKGNVDIVASQKRVVLNKTGTPYMTKGGFGDTLAGLVGSFAARNVDLFTAASAAAYVNGKAGERAAKRLKEGMMPFDLIQQIPFVR